MFTGPRIVKDGLIFGYDADDRSERFYKGEPTTNLFTGTPSVYNNVPGHVTVILEATSDTYKGATIYKETITPLTSTGVGYLSNGSNPGIGVMHSYRNFVANNYMGYSIFYKPTVAMYTNPIFNQYSNIPGWQNPYSHDDMGDGWYRAWTTWYDTVSRNDSKFWAINPLTATIGVSIVIYWAGMFIENLNQNWVSKYTLTSRSNTDSLIDLKNTSTIDLSNMSYNSTGQPIFNGSNNYINVVNPTFTNLGKSDFTLEAIIKIDSDVIVNNGYYKSIITKKGAAAANAGFSLYFNTGRGKFLWSTGDGTSSSEIWSTHSWNQLKGKYAHIVMIRQAGSINNGCFYINGVYEPIDGYASILNVTNTYPLYIGAGSNLSSGFYFDGEIPIVKLYNRGLSENEIIQNYNSSKNRFNI